MISAFTASVLIKGRKCPSALEKPQFYTGAGGQESCWMVLNPCIFTLIEVFGLFLFFKPYRSFSTIVCNLGFWDAFFKFLERELWVQSFQFLCHEGCTRMTLPLEISVFSTGPRKEYSVLAGFIVVELWTLFIRFLTGTKQLIHPVDINIVSF